eukprot:1292978-Alexandrium_andersonii.AAC.1
MVHSPLYNIGVGMTKCSRSSPVSLMQGLHALGCSLARPSLKAPGGLSSHGSMCNCKLHGKSTNDMLETSAYAHIAHTVANLVIRAWRDQDSCYTCNAR